MTTPYLLTGVTGGLGAKILQDLLNKHKIPPNQIVATSRSASKRTEFENQGLQFRVADYDQPSTLLTAFQNVDNLLFMSSSERDTPKRNAEHANVIAAAKEAKVRKVWYVSLAFGGYGDHSTIGFQQAHYETENLLRDSGLNFISLRAGIYADAFPLFLNWYPTDAKILLPTLTPPISSGKIAFASRDDLGEGIATLLASANDLPIRTQGSKNIILLTGPKTESFVDIVSAIDNALHPERPVEMEYVDPQTWIEESARNDQGGKPPTWFESRVHFMRSVIAGDAETVDPALEVLLGRKPETGMQAVERLIREAGEEGYTWHQNYAR